MSGPVVEPPKCFHDGGQGIGAGHVCLCIREHDHPDDSDRPHACGCGAVWADDRIRKEPPRPLPPSTEAVPVPDGYTLLAAYRCHRCGARVDNWIVHNDWHIRLGE